MAARFQIAAARATLVLVLAWGATLLPPTYDRLVRAMTTGDYGRPDAVSWSEANQIAWFPAGANTN